MSESSPKPAWLALWVALAACCVMPGSDSLWIDEGSTAIFAMQPSLHDWWATLQSWIDSEKQMPFGMFFAWLFAKAFGTSELALRMANLPWAFAAVLAFARIGRRLSLGWLPLALVVQPFFWAYMNEARPYVMQIASGAWLLFALIECGHHRGLNAREWAPHAAISSVVLCAASMLGAMMCAAAVLVLAVMFAMWRRGPERRAILWFAGAALLLAPIGLYYVWTLKGGAGGAKNWNVGISNVFFAIYEFLGFSGLGPGRADLRDIARAGSLGTTLKSYAIPFGILAVCYVIAAIGFIRSRRSEPALGISAGVLALGFAMLYVAAVVVGFPFWGRHLAPAFPCAAVIVALLVRRQPVVASVMACVLAYSGLSLRFSERHGHDDYRAACAFTSSQSGSQIWWVASDRPARYYELPITDDPAQSPAVLAIQLYLGGGPDRSLNSLSAPSWIVISKPDLYDRSHAVTRYVAEHNYQIAKEFRAFCIYAKALP